MLVLTLCMHFKHDLVPLHVNITVFSLSIIIIGSYGSLETMIQEFKKVFIQGKKSDHIESVSKSDAAQFPLFAGGMLVGLYMLIQYLGKEYVNYFIIVYIAVGSTTSVKALLSTVAGNSLEHLDEKKIINIETKWFELVVTPLDLICFVVSCILVGIYVVSKSWIYNNILAVVFCIHALQFIFLGNFSTGYLLLTLLFFYDIFFVFGTDVMVTVAKNIDAPIKLQFPKNPYSDPPEYSILGLGDIVIPGIFISLALRFDFLKTVKQNEFERVLSDEKKGKADTNSFISYLFKTANAAPKVYFIACIVGYLIAIITTVVVMIVFEHGQPALLYLVPGCLGAVSIVACVRREIGLVKDFEENKYLDPEGTKKDQ